MLKTESRIKLYRTLTFVSYLLFYLFLYTIEAYGVDVKLGKHLWLDILGFLIIINLLFAVGHFIYEEI